MTSVSAHQQTIPSFASRPLLIGNLYNVPDLYHTYINTLFSSFTSPSTPNHIYKPPKWLLQSSTDLRPPPPRLSAPTLLRHLRHPLSLSSPRSTLHPGSTLPSPLPVHPEPLPAPSPGPLLKGLMHWDRGISRKSRRSRVTRKSLPSKSSLSLKTVRDELGVAWAWDTAMHLKWIVGERASVEA